MPDNWEYGIRRSTGNYIMFIEDKQVLKSGALKILNKILINEEYPVLCYRYEKFDNSTSENLISKLICENNVKIVDSNRALEILMNEDRTISDRVFPRGLNSCIHRNLKDKIINS